MTRPAWAMRDGRLHKLFTHFDKGRCQWQPPTDADTDTVTDTGIDTGTGTGTGTDTDIQDSH
jgi:hypothetical protein